LQIAVIADVHGNRWALEAVLEDIEIRGINSIVNLGDVLYGPLDPSGTAKILMRLNFPTVSGNEDRIVVERFSGHTNATLAFVRSWLNDGVLRWLAGLPLTLEVEPDLLLCHGTPESDTEYLLQKVATDGVQPRSVDELTAILAHADSSVILCGHDHTPGEVRLPDGRLIVNPGSVGLQAYDDDHPYFHKIEAGSPHARYSVLSKSESGWAVERVALEYDWETAARTASKNGRADWAEWLRTGQAG
jgi:predicted phosphodiesterase